MLYLLAIPLVRGMFSYDNRGLAEKSVGILVVNLDNKVEIWFIEVFPFGSKGKLKRHNIARNDKFVIIVYNKIVVQHSYITHPIIATD